jgi:hypothetical protein
MALNLILYSTSHCHLCEQAESILKALSDNNDIAWTSLEISEDSILLQLYETKIPVLKRVDNNIEIAWPFTAQDIRSLIAVDN